MIFQTQKAVPDGAYPASVLSIEQQAPSDHSPTENPYLRWTFKLSVDGEMSQLVKNTSLNFGPRSNARRLVESLLGRAMKPGETINMADYLPMDCQVVVKIDPESGYSRIVDVLRAKTKPQGVGEEGINL
jgi:hypothetical protein